MRHILYLFLFIPFMALGQYTPGSLRPMSGAPGTQSRQPLNSLERARGAGETTLTDTWGNIRLATYVNITNPLNVAYTPTATGNTSFYSTFFRSTTDKSQWFVDWNGRGLRLNPYITTGTAGITPLPSSPQTADVHISTNSVSGNKDVNFYNGTAWETVTVPNASGYWTTTGNTGTAGTGFLGTNDNFALRLGVNANNYLTMKPANVGIGVYGPIYLHGSDAQANASFAANSATAYTVYETAFGIGSPSATYNEAWDGNDKLFGVYNGISTPSTAFAILKDGRVGIGTATPSAGAILEVNGTIRILGGSPGDGKVLTSDATGTAIWADPNAAITTLNVTASSTTYTATTTTNRIVVNPSAAINTVTIRLPTNSNFNGRIIKVFFGGTIAASVTPQTVATSVVFSTTPTANKIYGVVPNTFVGGDCLEFEWDSVLGSWRRLVL